MIKLDFNWVSHLFIHQSRYFQTTVDDNFFSSTASIGKYLGVVLVQLKGRNFLERIKLIVACGILFSDRVTLITIIQFLFNFYVRFELSEAN